MARNLFRFVAFSTLNGDSLGCGGSLQVALAEFAADGGDTDHVEVLLFDGSAGSHVWDLFLPLYIARSLGEPVYRKHVVTSIC
jgi:hypothetical protein